MRARASSTVPVGTFVGAGVGAGEAALAALTPARRPSRYDPNEPAAASPKATMIASFALDFGTENRGIV